MKIEFVKDTELEVIETYDEHTDTFEGAFEIFKCGTIIDGDKFGDENNTIDFQFGDGSLVVGMNKELFKVIEE